MTTANGAGRVKRASVIRRKPSLRQGQALECLGHAIEYLIDSSMHDTSAREGRERMQAAQLLMKKSVAVFKECPEIVSLGQRFFRWAARLRKQLISDR